MLLGMVDLAGTRIERIIAAARGAIAWESLWAALCWPLILGAALLALMFSGLLPQLPGMLRLGVSAALIAGFTWSLRPLATMRWPTAYQGMRRIEAETALSNRPISTRNDTLPNTFNDEQSLALWEEHKRRQLAGLSDLKIGTPHSAWRDLDPYSLRVPASLALIASLFLAQGDNYSNLKNALQIGIVAAPKVVSLDAWLKPPGYTGKPPLLLTSPATIEKLKTDGQISVPENSGLTIRLSGADKPRLSFYEIAGDPQDLAEIKNQRQASKFENGQFQAETKLDRPVLAKIFDGEKELASWRLFLTADNPPTITILDMPKIAGLGGFSFKWKTADDYGVAKITSEIDLADNQEDGVGFDSNGVFLFDPPKLPVSLRKASPKEEAGTTSADLTAHPWAGLMVELSLTATDAASHQTTSNVISFKLPERLFIKPLARALVEQRKTLIMDPDTASNVEVLLSAILTYPDGLIENSGTHLAIATIVSRLQNIHDRDDLEAAIDALWKVALIVEEGELSNARSQLEAARKALEEALRNGASPEQLAELMSKLREAMDRYMQSLAEETKKREAQGQQNKNRAPSNSKTITQQDLQKMLDTIDKLAQNGANEAAQEMLAQLEEILKNLQPGMAQQGDPNGQQSQEMLNELSELMRKQQDLMDQTQRQPGGEQEGEPNEGDDPGNRSGNQGSQGLADQQGSLGEQLQQFMQQLGQLGMQAPQSLGQAGKEMGNAQDSLERQDQQQALGQQGEALNQMRQGAQEMARQMQQQAQGNQDNSGRDGQAKGDARDPLGRPLPSSEDQFGPDKNMLPSELAIRRAREILEMLRARANAPELPRIDKDYIERLLRGLY